MADDEQNEDQSCKSTVAHEKEPDFNDLPPLVVATESTINGATAEEIANDLKNYLDFDVSKEESKLNDSVEMMLTKLDEFFSLVDMIRSDTSLCLQSTMPDIQAKCKEMDVIFDKIDKLEEFVNVVKESVSSMEEKVTKAEGELGTVGGLVKKLTSFISKKPSPTLTSRGRQSEFIPPHIFSTEEYFHTETSDQQQQGSSTVLPDTVSPSLPDTNNERTDT